MNTNLKGKTAVVTAAGGAIGGAIARAFADEGVRVALWDLRVDAARENADSIVARGGSALAIECDVLAKANVESAASQVMAAFETIDILVNGVGGSRKQTTTSPELEFFDIREQDMEEVMALNYLSAVIPAQVVGRIFAEKQSGAILNISSIAGFSPLSRSLSYSNGKAATNNFTEWLAVHMAQTYSPKIRVNAIAPGFMLTEQNRFLLTDEKTGEITERGRQILNECPMNRYGNPEEVAGAAVWLVSDQAGFVTGAIIPVDGGFTAFCGV